MIAKLSADLFALLAPAPSDCEDDRGCRAMGPRSGGPHDQRRRIDPPSHRCGIHFIGVLLFGLGGWASTVEISGALIAQGSLVVDSNVKKVQHPTGGVVGELLCADGDHVKEGHVLLRLDETVTRANLAIVTKGLTELYARKARLAAERDGADSSRCRASLQRARDDPDVKERIASERKLFDLRRTARSGQKRSCRSASPNCSRRSPGLPPSSAPRTRNSA